MVFDALGRREGLAVPLEASLWFAVASMPLLVHLAGLDMEGTGWGPDTRSFVEGRPWQQPLYGAFYRFLTGWGLSEGAVRVIQGTMLAGALLLFWLEAVRLGVSRLVLLLCLSGHVFALKFGAASSVTGILSEGLFYPALLLCCAAAFRYSRGESVAPLVCIVVLATACVLSRGAAVGFAVACAGVLLLAVWSKQVEVRRDGLIALGALLVLLAMTPMLLGRGIFDVQPAESRFGFVVFPRAALLETPVGIAPHDGEKWDHINASFRAGAEGLSPAEISMFDSQVQEVVRYYIGKKVIFGHHTPPPGAPGTDMSVARERQAEAADFFWTAVKNDPFGYLRNSAAHLYAILTAGNYIGNESRRHVFKSLEGLNPAIWKLAPFRTDYPLNSYDERLKPHTAAAYLYFRLLNGGAALLIMGVAAWIVVFFCRSRLLSRDRLAFVLISALLMSHSLVVAAFVFPDRRFTLANVFLISGAVLLASRIVGNTCLGRCCTRLCRWPRSTW